MVTAEVLIVGAGPVGLTAAAACVQHGLRCRIVDKSAAPTDKSKALAVWCRTLELLDTLGLAAEFVATGLKIDGGSIYADGKRVVHLDLRSDESPFGFPLMIPQCDTERLLTAHLARLGLQVERQVELVSFADRGDAVTGKLRHADGTEETFTVPWLIGCDGAHSTVRHGLALPFTGEPEPNDWMLADVRIDGPVADNEVSIYWHEKGPLALFPIRGGHFRVIADRGVAGASSPADPTLADVQAKVDERGPVGLKLRDPVWLSNFRIHERKVRDYRKGRVLLAGDAAHIHSPAGGQGMNTGMQDAFNLAWKLALVQRGAGQTEALLHSYSVERSAVGDQVLRDAARFTTLATLRSPVAQWLRNHVAPIVASFPFVRDRIRDNWFELSVQYRHSPLAAEKWPALGGGLQAGDRMCDAALTSCEGKATTLFALLRANRHALLLLPCTQDPEARAILQHLAESVTRAFPEMLVPFEIVKPADEHTTVGPCWIDSAERLHEKLHATAPTAVVIRPDGYVGFRCQPADENAVLAYLDRYLVRGRV